MIFLRSVVGKLWFTILLLVSFVLLILTVLLLEFFENYNVHQVEDDLLLTANRIVNILEIHDDPDDTLEISSQLLGHSKNILVFQGENQIFPSEPSNSDFELSIATIKKDKDLYRVFTDGKVVSKELNLKETGKELHTSSVKIVGVPLTSYHGKSGVVFVFQSLETMKDSAQSTTKFILLAAGVAIILTTIFAFFLSTRITAPLRKMREAAFEVARGKFDTKVPILSNDEIGELATAFNQMGKQLKFNMNALSQEKENLSSILSSMADGVITINIDGTIQATNPPAEQFLQFWYTEVRERGAQSPEAPMELMKLFHQSVETEQEQIGEINLGDHYWVIIVSPLYNNKNIRGAVAVLRDMTEDRKLEKMRNDFIANVSHELRTPISMLLGYSEAIIDDIAKTAEEKKDIARIINDESLRMGRLVNELLDLARMEAGYTNLNYENIQLGPYINRITGKFSGLAQEKNVKIHSEIHDYSVFWAFDGDRIEQVLTNLIDNALRHTPDGGTISVIEYINDQSQLVISVKDTGVGIAQEDLPFVFDRFYKADKARTRGRSGTGLGLAIAHNIVKAHSGEIFVNSVVNVGTTFTFLIPQNTSFVDKNK
ncbi:MULTISPECIES: ATP-binding protein [Bacillus]|uniref:ATP-binding protein n=1 Tax=Bacillus TaxID=1386 RepID=UPI0002D5E534|nr:MULTISPECIES: ATP-binding protein [Bacillus]